MKRFLILLSLMFCNALYADTINLHWLNDDGTTYQDSTCVIDSDLILPSTPPTKYGYTFTGWKMASYIPIEYLESTGTQWIDTEYKFSSNNASINTSFIPTDIGSVSVNRGRLFGSYNQSTRQRGFSFYIWSNLTIGCGGTDIPTNANIQVNNLYTVSINANNGYLSGNVNGTNISGTYTGSIANNFDSYLFKTKETTSYPFYGKLYYFQIYDDETLVRDFIPVLDYSGTPCMYDNVTQRFFYNQGTGNFIAGPIVSE